MRYEKILLIVLVIWNFSNSQAQNYDQLDQFFEPLFDNDKIMGNLTISKYGQTVYNKSVGYQFINEKESKPITELSKFRIGSISKTFMATMIFQLVDEGKIKRDNTLFKYFPEIPGSEDMTIANLLNHSSGLFNIPEDDTFNEYDETTRSKMLAMISSHEPVFKAGEENVYCNTNYVLLGYILEDIEKTNNVRF